MKDSILCCAFFLGLGMVVGGVVVSNNSKVRRWLVDTQNKAEEICDTVKKDIEEKLKENKMNEQPAQSFKKNN